MYAAGEICFIYLIHIAGEMQSCQLNQQITILCDVYVAMFLVRNLR